MGYSIKRDGKAIDPRNANAIVDMPRDEATPPASLTDALRIAAEIPDTEMRRLVQSNLRQSYQQDKAIADFEYGQRIEAIEQYLARPDATVAQIPPEVFGALKPKDQERLLKGQREKDEVDVMEEIARDPSIVTKQWLYENRSQMTRTTFNKLLGDLNDPMRLQKAIVDAELVNATLVRNGLTELAFPKSLEERSASLLFRDNVTEAIRFRQTQAGHELSEPEKRAVIDNLLLDRAFSKAGASNVIAAMTPDQQTKAYEQIVETIPPDDERQIREALRAMNQLDTTANIANLYLSYQRANKGK